MCNLWKFPRWLVEIVRKGDRGDKLARINLDFRDLGRYGFTYLSGNPAKHDMNSVLLLAGNAANIAYPDFVRFDAGIALRTWLKSVELNLYSKLKIIKQTQLIILLLSP